MMGSNGQTIINYGDTALPLVNTPVTLFNSAVAFASPNAASGGSFHLLGLQWFQWTILFDGTTGSITGTVTGDFSNDKGLTWTQFYTTAALNDDIVNEDEVYVGMFKDVRFRFTVTVATEAATVFNVNLALNPHKPTSKAAATDILGGNLGALA